MKMKKLSIIIVTVLLLATISVAAMAKTTVTVWQYDGENSGTMRWSIEKFNESQDEIYLEERYVPFADMNRELVKAISIGQTPDVVQMDNPATAKFASMGALADITDYVEEWGKGDLYFEGPMNSNTWEGRLYGLPVDTNCIALYYNKEMLAEAGFDSPPETWKELKEYVRVLTKPEEDVYGIAFGINKSVTTFQFIPWLKMAGASIFELDSEEAANALNLWKYFVDNGYASQEIITWWQSDALNTVASGNAAMAVDGPWDRPIMEDVDFEWGVALLPYKEDVGVRASAMGGANISIMADSKVKDAAWEFIKWMNQGDIAKQRYLIADRIPPRKDIAEAPEWTDDPVMEKFVEQQQYAVARGPHPEWNQIDNAIADAVHKALTDTLSVEEALAEAADKIEELTD